MQGLDSVDDTLLVQEGPLAIWVNRASKAYLYEGKSACTSLLSTTLLRTTSGCEDLVRKRGEGEDLED